MAVVGKGGDRGWAAEVEGAGAWVTPLELLLGKAPLRDIYVRYARLIFWLNSELI